LKTVRIASRGALGGVTECIDGEADPATTFVCGFVCPYPLDATPWTTRKITVPERKVLSEFPKNGERRHLAGCVWHPAEHSSSNPSRQRWHPPGRFPFSRKVLTTDAIMRRP
jgi:hypothetical protein